MNRNKVELSEAKGRAKNQVSKSKSIFLSVLLIIGLSLSLSAQDFEVKKEIFKSYKVTKDFTLGIENKYGTIDLVNWDKNELEVVVEIIVKAPSEGKAKKILNKIDVDINEGGKGVDFLTKIEWGNLGIRTSVEINYKVSAPVSINANLTQKYGSIFLEELTGDANIVVKYGSLKAQSLMNASGKANELAMAYSNGAIKSSGKLNAKLAYSEIKFGSVESYIGKLSYSSFVAKNLSGKMVSEAAYSDVEIENVAAGFELLDLTFAYGDVKLIMDSNATYSYSLDTKYGSLDAPAGAEKVREKDRDHGPNYVKAVKGRVGSSPSGKVYVTAKYGDVTLK